jgi:hypothetical protein
MDLLLKGLRFWKSCVHHHTSNTIPSHKLKGKLPNNKRKFLEDYQESLNEHFEELEKEAEPIATRYVRELTGETTLRDRQDDLVYLPSFFSVRKCYGKYCLEKRGVIVTTNNKGKVIKKAATGDVVNNVPCWTAYCRYWKDQYPNMKVRKPTQDICNYCYKIYNGHKFLSNTSSGATATGGGEQAESIEERVIAIEEDEDEPDGNANATADLNQAVSVTPFTNNLENTLLAAALHVRQARAMRAFVNSKIDESRRDRAEKTQHTDRTYTFIADYCQNMELPHFGNEQPGETYYLTPAKLEGFGVADVSYLGDDGSDADHLYFHCYQEGYGAKGGLNVASMIVKTMNKIGVLKHDDSGAPVRGKELNIVMDNCGGQNKNNFVLLLAPYLVEMGYFKTVNMLFLVVGHTKNVCDRRFNNLKQEYHRSQVFTIDQAVGILGRSKHVTVWKIDPDNDWKDYASFLLLPYVKLSKARLLVTKNHIFCAEWNDAEASTEENTSTKMRFYTRRSALDEHQAVYGNILNNTFAIGANRIETLKAMAPERVVYAGLPNYKRILMHKNYVHFVPQEYHNDPLYQRPSKDVIESEEKDQKERRAYKKMKKEQKTVKHDDEKLEFGTV